MDHTIPYSSKQTSKSYLIEQFIVLFITIIAITQNKKISYQNKNKETAITKKEESLQIIKPKSFRERILSFFSKRDIKRFKEINSDLEKILIELDKKPNIVFTLQDYKNAKRLVGWISKFDALLKKVDYFESKELENESKKAIELIYMVETETKIRAFEQAKTEIKPSKYFISISQHSKKSLIKSITSKA